MTGLCRNGHRRTLENLSKNNKCIICTETRRKLYAAQTLQAKRLARDRIRTAHNRSLDHGVVTHDETADERLRSESILHLIDLKGLATTRAQRDDYQAQIDALTMPLNRRRKENAEL